MRLLSNTPASVLFRTTNTHQLHRIHLQSSALRSWMLNRRCMNTSSPNSQDVDIRQQITSDVKEAMRSKDIFTSTVLRSVLADVQIAEKANGRLSNSGLVSLIRKVIARRNDSTSQYASASRPDLAAIESREAELLSKFLPPLLSQERIDAHLQEVIEAENLKAENPRKSLGLALKAFYAKVDKAHVDGQVVKKRAEVILGLA